MDSWDWKAVFPSNNPQPRQLHVSVVYKDSLYIHGGFGEEGAFLGDLQQYQFANNSWREIKLRKKPTNRHSHSAVVFADHLYIFGGTHEGQQQNDLHRYSFAKKEWKEVKQGGSIPAARWGHSVVLIDHLMFLFGGFTSTWCNDLYCLDLNTSEWQKIESSCCPSPRQFASLCSYKGKLYLYGGFVNSSSLSDLHCYDLSTKSWSQLMVDPSVIGRRGHQVLVSNGIMFVHGGRDESGPTDDIILYNIEEASWSNCELNGKNPSPRYFHTLSIWENGIYVWGGLGLVDKEKSTKSQCLSDMYILSDPEDDMRKSLFVTSDVNQRNPFTIFPRDILMEILAYLPAEDLCQVGRVNKFFRYSRYNESLWRGHLLEIVGQEEMQILDGEFENFKLKENGYYFNNYSKEMQRKIRIVSEKRKLQLAKFIPKLFPEDSTGNPDIKMVVVGDGGVGKSAMTIMLIQQHFVDEYDPTIEDSYRKQIKLQDQPIFAVDILDTAGPEEFSAMRDQYMRTSSAFVVAYDVTNRHSFDSVQGYVEQARRVKDNDLIPIIIAGNKIDLEDQRSVTYEEGATKAKQLNCEFAETSAKDNLGMDVFEQAAWMLIDLESKNLKKDKQEKEKKKCLVM
eukprot:TRINITY_DN1241_c0_g2_i3.p1 TRINITY_DN1241_c0_g2~~TRINITY_DN1241_c0_g2_i3.p1  ORF type:complete len:622 (-),score=127.03 TRINITY_DN1241_c0_g2_i3:178-2043(-)